jgi:Transglutaminase-like superfamily/Domain of Unknown Function with PDB structure (DUF3857)
LTHSQIRWWLRLAILFLLCGTCLADGPSQDWIPLTPQDLEMKEVPGNPGAAAVQLYFADYISETDYSEFYYYRIKILKDSGRSLADVEIPVPTYRGVKLQNLQARTIQPGGRIVDYTGTPFEKVILKGRGFKFLAETFTLPEVSVGSIIEYKYKLKGKDAWSIDDEWLIEQNLFTVREHFWFGYPEFWFARFVASPGIAKMPTRNKGNFELEMNDVPAFQREEQMPPEQQYRQNIRFLYGADNYGYLGSWLPGIQPMSAAVDAYVAPRKEVREAAAEAVGKETGPEQQLRKLYARAQQVRNLTYERQRSEAEEKKEQLKENKNAADVIRHGYGYRDDISFLFVAMARTMGFDASVVLVASRRRRLFDRNWPAVPQMDSRIVAVKLNGRDVYLDPGTKFCPYGLLRWIYTSTPAVRVRGGGLDTFSIPDPLPGSFMINRTSDLTLDETGSLQGELTVEYRTGEALEHRLDALETDEPGRIKQLEEELKSWLPDNSVVKLRSAEGWESDGPLMASFTIQAPGFATVSSKRILMPTCLFAAKLSVFNTPTRKYPIYFPFPFTEVDRATIRVPAGYVVESVPPQQSVTPTPRFAGYETSSQVIGQELIVQRTFEIRRIALTPGEYSGVRDFFGSVRANDALQAVFRQADPKN